MSDQNDLGILILRVVIGFTMAAHGYNKFFGGGKIEGTGRWFDSIGMKPGRMHALLAAWAEVVAGMLLVLGFLTSLAGAAFVALMFVAAYTVHKGSGFFVVGNGWEYNLVLATVGVGIATAGPGEWSIDHIIGLSPMMEGWWGLLIALVGGLAAAGVQLGIFFRPSVHVDES